ncbi:hypothetical protein BGZ60DRAFT_522319 [Tricladium varicosporioides]|nr:hypothetical protein BGZ60DRAFT_522319 [Hymenoscyphus varicosporioides]
MPPVRQNPPRRLSSRDSSRPASSRIEGIRTGINHLFTGRSRIGTPRSHTPESPKTPRLALGLGNLSSTRIVIPYLTRTNTNSSQSSQTPIRPQHTPHTSVSSRPIAPNPHQQQAPVSTIPPQIRHNGARRFRGVDPAETHLAELAEAGRRRRNKVRSSERRCGPKIKNRKIRAKILTCFISGLFLTLVLTVYLALALSNRNESQEFHVLLILIILITTIFFCHALVRLCMMIINPPPEGDPDHQEIPTMVGPGGYANPAVPIRVALARDEEAAGIESDATKLPPPAYGLWRESVRVDPNRLYWARNEAALQREQSARQTENRPQTANRPPSYISDDGIDYVVEAAPRSIAPITDVPLPPHPSERGRVWPMP